MCELWVMNKVLIVIVAVLMLSSCMHSFCPTYSGTKGYSEATASSRKQKEMKNRTPYYKVVKRAEQD